MGKVVSFSLFFLVESLMDVDEDIFMDNEVLIIFIIRDDDIIDCYEI